MNLSISRPGRSIVAYCLRALPGRSRLLLPVRTIES